MSQVIAALRRWARLLVGSLASPPPRFDVELRRAIERSDAVTIRLDALERSRAPYSPNDSNKR